MQLIWRESEGSRYHRAVIPTVLRAGPRSNRVALTLSTGSEIATPPVESPHLAALLALHIAQPVDRQAAVLCIHEQRWALGWTVEGRRTWNVAFCHDGQVTYTAPQFAESDAAATAQMLASTVAAVGLPASSTQAPPSMLAKLGRSLVAAWRTPAAKLRAWKERRRFSDARSQEIATEFKTAAPWLTQPDQQPRYVSFVVRSQAEVPKATEIILRALTDAGRANNVQSAKVAPRKHSASNAKVEIDYEPLPCTGLVTFHNGMYVEVLPPERAKLPAIPPEAQAKLAEADLPVPPNSAREAATRLAGSLFDAANQSKLSWPVLFFGGSVQRTDEMAAALLAAADVRGWSSWCRVSRRERDRAIVLSWNGRDCALLEAHGPSADFGMLGDFRIVEAGPLSAAGVVVSEMPKWSPVVFLGPEPIADKVLVGPRLAGRDLTWVRAYHGGVRPDIHATPTTPAGEC